MTNTKQNKEVIKCVVDKTDNVYKQGKPICPLSDKEKKKIVIQRLKEHLGIITISCQGIISRETFYQWLKTDKKFAEEVKKAEEIPIGEVEDRLKKLIVAGNPSAIIFYLKSKHIEYKPKQIIEFGNQDEINKTLNLISNVITGVSQNNLQDKQPANLIKSGTDKDI